MQKLTKEGLQRTDKRIGLMNEILAAMDTVKYVKFIRLLLPLVFTLQMEANIAPSYDVDRCYAWENSFEGKVQSIRGEELSWFRKAQMLAAV